MRSPLRNTVVAAGALLALVLSVETAAAWSCHARSRVGDGWGYSPVLATAREEARLQCMLHTPRRMPCRIVLCRR